MKRRISVTIVFFVAFALSQRLFTINLTASNSQQQTDWQIIATPPKPLRAIDMLDETNGWAVGNEGLIMRWNGTNWSTEPSPTNHNLLAISMNTPTDGWAVGTSVILHWDGITWTDIANPSSEALRSINMVSNNLGWATGDAGRIIRWNGSQWLQETTPITNADISLRSVKMLSSTEGWAVGGALNSFPGTRTILRWDGNNWSIFSSVTAFRFLALSFSSSSSGVAVGSGGDAAIWNGTDWITKNLPSQNQADSVVSISSSNAWAVNVKGEIFQWNGTVWTQNSSPTTQPLHGIDIASELEIWAVGDNVILRYQDTAPVPASLTSNYSSGRMGSYFTLEGVGFPSDSITEIQINSLVYTQTVPVSASGMFTIVLDTDNADNGIYYVSARVNPDAGTTFVITSTAPLRSQEGVGFHLTVPSGIALNRQVFLPSVIR